MPPPLEPCPLCNADPAFEFAASELFVALYNRRPILPGHSLVIPRRHVESVDDLTDDECSQLVPFARRVTTLLTRHFDADGFDWALQAGQAAGQTVPHLHLHVVPRRHGDLPRPEDWHPLTTARDGDVERDAVSAEELATIVARLRGG